MDGIIERLEAKLPERLPMLRDSKLGVLNEHGGDRTSNQVDNINLNTGGTNPDYIISRLKRDNPELAQKVLFGKISANEAAIQSGIRKKYVSVRFAIYSSSKSGIFPTAIFLSVTKLPLSLNSIKATVVKSPFG